MLYVDRMIRAGDLKLNMGGTPLINTCTFFETASGIQDIVRDDSVSNTTPPKEELFLPNFLEVLLRASRLQASDSRDLVFAFLGHPAALVGGSPIIKADYTKTIEEVYTQAAAAELVGRNNFHALSMVSHEPSLHGRLPSWVPDFSRGIGVCYGMLWESAEYFCATDVEAHVKANDLMKILKLRGTVLDHIVERTDVMRERDFQLDLETPRSDADWHPWDWMQDLVRKVQSSHLYRDKGMDITLGLLLVGGLVQLDWAEDRLDQHLANLFAYCAHVPVNLRSEAWEWLNQRANLSSGKSLAIGDWKGFQGDHEYACVGRRAFTTKKGYLGLGPMATQPGDLVCVLFGAKVPFILRYEEDHYLFVGECYVHGIMRGEAVEMWRRGELEEVEFEIH
jgi:hypothetical protein